MTTSDPTASLVERLSGIDASSLSDADKSLRVVSAKIRPVRPGVRLVGRAVTARANADLMSVIAALRQAGAGDVIVVEAGSPDWAVAGELFATEAIRKGVTGIVIDGLCRDTPTLRTIDLPVFARGATPRACPARKVPVIQVPVSIGGVVVNPGDLVLGDDDGIVVGSETEFAAAIDRAGAIQSGEAGLRARIEAGTSLFATMNYDEHVARLAAGQDSALSLGI
ncbi:MAG TPA: RraA family protein [Propionibacteriaceae bacterium]